MMGKISLMGKKSNSADKPVEVSSKKPFNPFEKAKRPTTNVLSRDPRFDPLCGKFNEDLYQKSYKFVDSMRRKEVHELETKLKKCTNLSVKQELKQQLQKQKQQLEQKEKQQRIRGKVQAFRKTQRELVKKGVKPFYLKKSDVSRFALEDKMEQVKKSGGSLKKLLEKRRKHLSSKQHKMIPRGRRMREEES